MLHGMDANVARRNSRTRTAIVIHENAKHMAVFDSILGHAQITKHVKHFCRTDSKQQKG